MSNALVALGLVALVVGAIAAVRGRLGWAHIGSRLGGWGVVGVGVALFVVAGAVAPPDAGAPSAPTAVRSDAPVRSTTTAPAPTPASTTTAPSTASGATTPPAAPTTAPAKPGTALALLATLRVKGRAPTTGYSRDQFGPAWADVDRNGCDTRNDVLRRDLTGYVLRAGTHGCVVLSGTLHDPYTGRTIHFVRGQATSTAVQVDHVVALSDAWQKGAQQWPASKRAAFGNDPLNLLAVDGPTNESKGDGDAATWLPPSKAFRCAYVARQVAVKARYGLSVTSAERDAVARVLARCPGQRVPTSPPVRLGGGREAAAPAPSSRTTTPSKPAGGGTDPRFATCAEANAHGYGPYRRGVDPEYAWYVDRDGDGLDCEP